MISTMVRDDVVTSGINSQSNFRIKACGKAFRILSDGLYSDKVTAVIRELACNAYDSHVAAGKRDIPFAIHLPNLLEPFFSIRDYGTGISHEDIFTVYQTYFESTKDQSNDFIGVLGLGSKSPLSVTDNFSVTSYYNGMKRVYSVYVNEDDMPTVALMSEAETTEINGLEIKFTANDSYNYMYKAQTVLKHFKVKPIVTGAANFIIPATNYTLSGSGWGIGSYRDGAKAIMGNVIYPINGLPDDIKTKFHGLLQSSLNIHFNIGELEFVASREALSYNHKTNAAIHDKLLTIYRELKEVINKKLEKCETRWEAYCLVGELLSGSFSFLRSIGIDSFEWRGEAITSSYIDVGNIGAYCEIFTKTRRGKIHTNPIEHITTKDETVIYENDMASGRGANKRIKYNIEGLEWNDKLYVVRFPNAATRNAFLKKLDMPSHLQLISVNSLPTPPRKPRQKKVNGAYVQTNGYKYNGNRDWRSRGNWDSVMVDLSKGGIYVIIERYKIGSSRPYSHFDHVIEHVNYIDEKFTLPEVYGFKGNQIEVIKKHKNWISLDKYIGNLFMRYLKGNQTISDDIAKIKNATNIEYYTSGLYNKLSGLSGYLPTMMQDFVTEYEKNETVANNNISKIINLLDNYNVEYKSMLKAVKKSNINEQAKAILAKFPMITIIKEYIHGDDRKVLINYLKG